MTSGSAGLLFRWIWRRLSPCGCFGPKQTVITQSVITTTPNEPEVNTKQTKQADSVETPVVM